MEWKTGCDMENRINVIEEMIKELDELSDERDLSEMEIKEIKRLNVELWEAVKFRKSVWHKKSRMIWLKESDSNSSFFHRAVKIRRKNKMVYRLKIGDSWRSEPKMMKTKMFNFFRSYFSCQTRKWIMNVDLNFRKLEEDIALKLEVPFSRRKLRKQCGVVANQKHHDRMDSICAFLKGAGVW